MSSIACKICSFDGPSFNDTKEHPCPGNPNFGNPDTRDLMLHGWSFGTYPKVCPKCPKDNEFLGSKDSHLCYNHAVESRNNASSIVEVTLLSQNKNEAIFTHNVHVLRR